MACSRGKAGHRLPWAGVDSGMEAELTSTGCARVEGYDSCLPGAQSGHAGCLSKHCGGSLIYCRRWWLAAEHGLALLPSISFPWESAAAAGLALC